jgi:putative ABC transport system ATP-binding protein
MHPARATRDGAGAGSGPTLRARGLSKVYRPGELEVHALRGVDLDLRAGELVVLLARIIREA